MARKRANDMGSVYKNEARGRWEAKYVAGRKPDGTLIRRVLTGRNQTEAEQRLNEALKALNQGLDAPDNRARIDQYATWWLENVLPGEGLAPKSERWYRDTINAYVLPKVGHRTLTGPRALTPGDVERMTAELMKDGRSHRTAVSARTALGKMLRDAEQRGRVGRNVARLAKPPRNRGKARPVKAHTAKEVAALLAALDAAPATEDTPARSRSVWYPVVVVGATTGLRPGELLALHWPDIHLKGKEPYLSVRHAMSYPTGSPPTLKAPKRDRSYRTVPLAPEAVTALKARRKAQAAEKLTAGQLWSKDWPELVFTTEAGTPLRVDVYRQVLNRALPGSHPHRLRHTYATHLLELGTPTHHVAELLGDSVATVDDTYSHVLRTKHEVATLASGIIGVRK